MTRKIGHLGLLVLIGTFLFTGLLPWGTVPEAEAIPAFARENKVACSLCHVGFPKLNSVGIAFKQNGYRLPGSQGTYLWEKPIPLGIRVNFQLPSYEDRDWNVISGLTQVPPPAADGAPGESRTDFSDTAFKIQNWQLLAGGTLAPDVSFFFQVVGEIEGQASTNFEFPAPDDAPGKTEIETEAIAVQIDDILPNGMVNLRAGKDHVDNLFFSRPRRLTLASYLTMFQPLTGASLHANVIGVEVNGYFENGIWYAVGFRNRHPRFNSSNLNEVRPGAYYGVLNVPIPYFPNQTFGFILAGDEVGNENFGSGQGAPSFTGTEAPTLGVGGVLDLHWGPFNLLPAFYYYTEGREAHESQGDFESVSGTVELHYIILNNLIATGRWDFLDVIGQPAGTFEDDIDQFVFSLAWYFHPNVRVVGEYSYLDAELNRLTTFPFNNDLFVTVPGALGSQRADLEVNKLTLAFEIDF